jgi:hypothetical protein
MGSAWPESRTPWWGPVTECGWWCPRPLLTSVRRGSRVTRCMGRIRKEIMGRPPHAGRFSMSLRTSRKVALLFLQHRTQLSLLWAGA